MKTPLIFFAFIASPLFGAVAIPPSDISPLATGTVLGRSAAGSGPSSALTTLPSPVQDNITRLGTVTSGTWNGGVVTGQYGGTGVANTGKTITLGGNFTTSGAFATTLTVTNTTTVTLPTSGTLATTAATVPSIAGTSGMVLVNGGTGSVAGSAVTLSLPTAITGLDSILFSTDAKLSRTQAGGLKITHPAGNNPVLKFEETATLTAQFETFSGDFYVSTTQSGKSIIFRTAALQTALTLNSSQNAVFAGSVTTAAPNGGTAAAWKNGAVRTSTGLLVSTTTGIQLDVAGTLYTLAVLTTNP